MKKGLLVTLLLVGTLSLASAAGGAEGAQEERVDLVLWGAGNLHPPEGTRDVDSAVNVALAQFEEDNPGITVELVIQPSDQLVELFRAASAARNGPDVVRLYGGSVNEFIPYLLPLNDYFTESELENYVGLEQCRLDYATSGPVYAIPADSYVMLVYQNKEVWSEAGIDTAAIPTDFDELLDLCEEFKQKGTTAWYMGAQGDAGQTQWALNSVLATMVGPGYGWIDTIETFKDSPYERAVDIWSQFALRGYVNEDLLSIGAGELPGMFANSGAAMMYGGNWQLGDLHAIMGENLGLFKVPAADPAGPYSDYRYAGAGSNTAITDYGENPNEAFMLLEVLVGDEFQAGMMNQKGIMPNNRNLDLDLIKNQVGRDLIEFSQTVMPTHATVSFPPKLRAEVKRIASLIGTGMISPSEVADSLDQVLAEVREDAE